MKRIRILIADDHAIVRTGLATVLDLEDDMTVVGMVRNGAEALASAGEKHPDVILMDLMMPVMSGVDATREIRKTVPEARVLVLTTYGTPDELQRALDAGAAGILLKSTENETIIDAIRRLAAGQTVIMPEIARQLQTKPESPALTDRQINILTSLTQGLSNKAIAAQMGISTPGVKKHLKTIFKKLGVESRTEAVLLALASHLVRPRPSAPRADP